MKRVKVSNPKLQRLFDRIQPRHEVAIIAGLLLAILAALKLLHSL